MASRDIDILLSAFDRRPAIDELFRSASPEDLSRWANALGELSQHLSSPTKLIEIYSKRKPDLIDLVTAIPQYEKSVGADESTGGLRFREAALTGKTPLYKQAADNIRSSEAKEAERSGIPPHNRMDDLIDLIQKTLKAGDAK